ncbi:MAG TPA: hypothetical protein VLT86_03170 [Vicinamibacterales bacterium]|nr:hypothetical protein [Vicinamibacterales bacterium]
MLRRLYRLVLLASPASVRRDLGADMEETFVFAVAALAFALTAAVACYVPARYVLRVNPVVALRVE